MADFKRRKNSEDIDFILDILHLLIGVLIVVLSIKAFLSPEDHLLFFPGIFTLASILNFMFWYRKFKGAEIKAKVMSFLYFLLGIFFLFIAILGVIIM